MMKRWVALAGALTALGSGANAAILVDGTPTGTRYFTAENISANQNFLVQFTLATASNITGFDILTCCNFGLAGTPVIVKIRNDVGGDPSGVNLFEFSDSVDSVAAFQGSDVFSSVSFGSIALNAGTYWFGVSGDGVELSWVSYDNGGLLSPPDARRLVGNNIDLLPDIHDLGYRIIGEGGGAGPIPEPATWAMMIGGFGLVGAAMRRHRRVTVSYA